MGARAFTHNNGTAHDSSGSSSSAHRLAWHEKQQSAPESTRRWLPWSVSVPTGHVQPRQPRKTWTPHAKPSCEMRSESGTQREKRKRAVGFLDAARRHSNMLSSADVIVRAVDPAARASQRVHFNGTRCAGVVRVATTLAHASLLHAHISSSDITSHTAWHATHRRRAIHTAARAQDSSGTVLLPLTVWPGHEK
jgi:hypothetical protein